jgi:hypothetical protein
MVTEEQIMAFLGQSEGDDLTPEELNQLSEEELVAYFIAQDEAKFNLGGKYDATASSPNESQNPDPALNIPLGGRSSVNPTINYQDGMVTPGVAAQNDNFSGYGNVEINKMGPQAVNAGISGDRFNVDANIPLSNPAGVNLRGEIDLLPPEKKEALALALELSPQDARYYLGLRYNY